MLNISPQCCYFSPLAEKKRHPTQMIETINFETNAFVFYSSFFFYSHHVLPLSAIQSVCSEHIQHTNLYMKMEWLAWVRQWVYKRYELKTN